MIPLQPRRQVAARLGPVPAKEPLIVAVTPGNAVAGPVGGTLKLAFVDDESDFLEALSLAAQSVERMDLCTLLATENNHLLVELNRLAALGWLPDLLCIDMNEASGKGVVGLEYLRMMRSDERWASLPIVLTTKTDSPEEEDANSGGDLVHRVYARGADGYLLGKLPNRSFLRLMRQQMPAWRHHARNRVWQALLEENREALQNAQGHDGLRQALQATLHKLQSWLHIDHAFVRKGPESGCPVWVQVGGPWAAQQPISNLTQIPLMQQVIDKRGQVTTVKKMSREECGPYTSLIGKAHMGCALVMDGQFHGVMMVVCDQSDRFGPLDGMNFQRLAEQVANVVGRLWMDRRNDTMREQLLRFSERLSDTHDERAVCQALAETAHAVMHDGVEWSKCTLRLVEPGYPLLRRYGQAGKVVEGHDIDLKLKQDDFDSMFRRAVVDTRVISVHTPAQFAQEHYLDNNRDSAGQAWWTSRSAITVPLALERPDSTADQPARSALGAINLECTEPGHYLAPEVQAFLESLALSAGRHIGALRTARFAQQALDLAVAAYSKQPDDLWGGVNDALFTLLGHNLLIQLDPPANWDGQTALVPWVVKRVFSIDPIKYSDNVSRWDQHFAANDWRQTFTKSCVEVFVYDLQAQPRFTADRAKFLQSPELFNEELVVANAVLPLRADGAGGQLSGVILLYWFSPPVMDKAMFEGVLSRFARYCALLLQHSADRQTGDERLRRAESQAAIAFAARQFEHVLNNRFAALQGLAENGLMSAELALAHAVLAQIREQLQRLDERASKAALYMRDPCLVSVLLNEIWNEVVAELGAKATRVQARVWPWGQAPGVVAGTAQALHVRSDAAYLWNALYVLVDNALDALATLPAAPSRDVWVELDRLPDSHALRVMDNGPGVARPDKLFIWGASTKPQGQGIALALARDRLRLVGVELTHCLSVHGEATAFQLAFSALGSLA